MTSVKPFKASTLAAGASFGDSTYCLYAIPAGLQVAVIVTDKGVMIMSGQKDITAQLPYLRNRMAGLHKVFNRTTGAGLTSERQRAFEKGVIVYGQLERRGMSSQVSVNAVERGCKAGPDDIALTVFAALPLVVYQQGQDTLGWSIRYQHFTRCLLSVLPVYDGTPPYIRPMARLNTLPWFNCGMAQKPGSREYWAIAEHEVMTNGTRDILAFDVYQPWKDDVPSCKLIVRETVASHFEQDDEL